MGVRLDWKGDRVFEKVMAATEKGINATTAYAAHDARGSHWWKSRTGALEANIINEPAERTSRTRVVGKFGTTRTRGFYGLFLERRTPFLRPAADRTFDRVFAAIRVFYR